MVSAMQFTVFDGLTELEIVSECPLPANQTILAVSSLDRHLFLVTDDHTLYAGYAEIGATSVDIHRIRSAVVDVQCCAYDARIYVVGTLGTVHHLAIHRDNCRVAEDAAWIEVPIVNPRPCPHGVASTGQTVPMVAVTGNVHGVIFSSASGELFGMGRFGGVLPVTDDIERPVAFECFRGLRVLQVVAGEHSVLVLTSGAGGSDPADGAKKTTAALGASSDTSSNDQSDDENVYVARDCARCTPDGGQAADTTSATSTSATAVAVTETNNTCTTTTTTSMASSGSERSDVFDEADEEHGDSSWTPESAGAQSKSIGDSLRTDKLKHFLMDTLSMGGGSGNGSNLTSLVRDGVRNLSRHMSGSDSNDPDETIVAPKVVCEGNGTPDPDGSTTDEGEQQSISLSRSVDDRDDQSDDDDDDGELEGGHDEDDERNTCAGIMCGKIANLSEQGERQLATSVWSFGTVRASNGVGGTNGLRTHISQVLGLSGQGVQAIASGAQHSVALTLDGRLYMWGSNREQQIESDSEVAAVKHPKRFVGASAAQSSVLAVACTRNSTEVLLNGLQMAVMMRQTAVATSRYRKSKEATEPRDLLLGSMEFVVQNASRPARKHIEMHYTAEQKYLRETLATYCDTLRPLLKRLHFGPAHKTPPALIEALCDRHLDLQRLAAVSVRSMRSFFRGQLAVSALPVLVHSAVYIAAYRRYTRSLCDLLAQPGGADSLDAELADEGSDAIQLLSRPLRRVGQVVELISTLLLGGAETPALFHGFLAERRAAWERLKVEVDVSVSRAMGTAHLWAVAGRSLTARLYVTDRRLVLDSKEVPLKWPGGGRFVTHWWLLFNDKLCRSSGVTNELHVYALRTLWVERGGSGGGGSNTQAGAFRVISPEETFELIEQRVSGSDSLPNRWLDALSVAIRQSLRRSSRNVSAANTSSSGGSLGAMPPTVPAHRNASYTFSDRHARFARAKYFGRWHDGRMHGLGHLEFANGCVYNGQMQAGEVTGVGRMFTPGVGIYAGDFVAGKYHGRGVLERKGRTATYEGHFRNGLFDGHGVLRTEQTTYCGEFAAGRKCGYGVLDDVIGGDKYIGMFADDKRCGRGVTITMAGTYFEGVFADDRLAGEGVAVFENGSYYEGELGVTGPCGRGTMYLPTSVDERMGGAEAMPAGIDDRHVWMVGHVLSGSSLSGVWEDVRIVSGNMTMAQSFAKIPRSLGLLTPEHSHKWRSLFADWETEVFGTGVIVADLSTAQLWRHFATYQANAQRRAILEACDNIGEGTDGLKPPFSRQTSQTDNEEDDANAEDAAADMLQATDDDEAENNAAIGEITAATDDDNKDKLLYKSNLCVVGTAPLGAEMFSEKRDIAEKLLNEQFRPARQRHRSGRPAVSLKFSGRDPNRPLHRADLEQLRRYLRAAFRSRTHPMGVLSARIAFCFYTAYGCWKVRPTAVLCDQAMQEWSTVVVQRIFAWVARAFPALLEGGCLIDGEPVSMRSLMLPVLLTERVYSTMFVLYASRCSRNDEVYRQRVLAMRGKTDDELAAAVRLDRDLWTLVQCDAFAEAIASLKQVKEQIGPHQMLATIEQTFRHIDRGKRTLWGNDANSGSGGGNGHAAPLLSADHIMPLSICLVLRAGIPHLGAELSLMEDLMGEEFDAIMSGFGGYCFVTIKATYQHIISSSNFGHD